MDAGLNIASSAMTALQNQPLTAQTGFKNDAAMDKAMARGQGRASRVTPQKTK